MRLKQTAVLVLLLLAIGDRAHAYGGLWSSQTAPVEQSAAAILFVDHPDDTVTAIIQIKYDGTAEEFAWLIPVPGTPTIGVSSSTVFGRLSAATAPQYWLEVAADGTCAGQQDGPDAAVYADSGTAELPSEPVIIDGPVIVIEQGSIEPYDYSTITVEPTARDPLKVATDWLTTNGYDLTDLDRDALEPYLEQGFNLLALKLKKSKEVGAIRPITLTYDSELPSIPIRPMAVAAQRDARIQVWVIGPSQAVPDNYKSLVINDARLDWLSARAYLAETLPEGGAGPAGLGGNRPRNYDAVVTAAANEAGGKGFVTELGGPASQYRDMLWSSLDEEEFSSIKTQSYADGLAAIAAAYSLYGDWDGWEDAVQGALEGATLPPNTTLAELSRDPERYRGIVEVDTATLLQLLEEKVVSPVADAAALLYEAPYLTRLFTTMSPREMTLDPIFTYNADLAQISNIHVAQQRIACSAELNQADAPWRVTTPQGGVIVGEGSSWPVDADSMPANLKVVMLSSTGSGTVLEDNSERIWMQLAEAGATATSTSPQAPRDGVTIGGLQTVTPYEEASSTPNAQSRDDGCSVARASTGKGSALALWFPLVALVFVRRRLRRAARSTTAVAACIWAAFILAGCSDGTDAPDAAEPINATGTLTLEQLRDPETCKSCHPVHYREWSSSMHAHAAQDPVFLAMNKRGQRETNGELGDFCVKCHAPMAVVDKLTIDGRNIEQLADLNRGVSCYFCHNAVAIEGDHNAQLRIANDTTMRGPIVDPVQPGVHGAEHSDMFEDTSSRSSAMCGACHDIVTPSGVALERTFQEYMTSVFSKTATGEPPAFDSCVSCHMKGREGFAAVAPGAGPRTIHEHLWPGVDLALIDFPNREAMRSAVEDCQLRISMAFFTLEVTPPNLFTFQMETSAGHNQPSGAAQDRRLWLEFLAYDEDGRLLEDVSSGNIADGEIEEKPVGDPKHDPHLLMFRDRIYGKQGQPVHMFWEAEKSAAYPDGYVSHTLPPATTTYLEGKHAVIKQYRASDSHGRLPARVTARLRLRPIGLDVLQDLVDSGDLDPAIMAEMKTLSLGMQIEWTPADGMMKTIRAAPAEADCNTYVCMLDPSSPECL